MRWYGHVLRIPKKVLHMKIEGKHPRKGPKTKMGTTHYKDVIQREDHGKKLWRRICGKIVTDGEAWLSDDPSKVEMSLEEQEDTFQDGWPFDKEVRSWMRMFCMKKVTVIHTNRQLLHSNLKTRGYG
jgi:hypothetical protein